jgi:two-component sensor histidine kinase/DNA-binding response OmpR family regulator
MVEQIKRQIAAEANEKVNILLVDDQPDKLLAYEVILEQLNENLVKASSARDALQFLLKNDVAVVLVDVCMPDLDGFQLASMIREHPRFSKTAIIFISAILLTDVDRVRGYDMGAVDYVPVPVVPEVLRAKVKIFAELFRKTRQLERLNSLLEQRVAERTSQLEASHASLKQAEQARSLALAAGQMGSWDWDLVSGKWTWDEGTYRIFGVDPATFKISVDNLRALVHPDDWRPLEEISQGMAAGTRSRQSEFRAIRPNGEIRWCIGSAAASVDGAGNVVRISGVTLDITDRKEAEARQVLLAREVDHRARNTLAVIQSIIRLTRAKTVKEYVHGIEGRIKALARAHTLLSDSRWNGADLATLVTDELAPYRSGDRIQCQGPDVSLQPATAQGLALALHELATNAAKHGALSTPGGRIRLEWELRPDALTLTWAERDGPRIAVPSTRNFGLKVITASIEQQLSGKAEFNWDPQGLRCMFSIPRSELVKTHSVRTLRNGADATAGAENSAGLTRRRERQPRVLLVEDEALVAMMIQETLAEFGFDVLGPVATVSEALAAAREPGIDAAVLDINLGDDLVYTVAEILARRGVPFVFVTGYDSDSVDARFSGIPVLQKPIERESLQRIFANDDDQQDDRAVAIN